MDAFTFIKQAKKADIYLAVNNKNLVVKNASKLHPKSRLFIQLHKAEIIAAIAANDELEGYTIPLPELPLVVGVFADFLDRTNHKQEPSPK
ncbi:MAG: hypothetical protein R8M45_07650, partial [Ghiorsea sp.]